MTKTMLPLEPSTTRKDYPLYSGLLSYFPNALAYVSYVSKKANDQHNPGEPLHWAREKSTDHADCLLRHLLKKGERDEDGLLETGKVAWRALALLEEELEARSAEAKITPSGGCVFADLEVEALPTTTFYDWSEAPEWAMWAATDCGEDSYFYELQPSYEDGCWETENGNGRVSVACLSPETNGMTYPGSLEARPQRSTAT